MAVGEIVKVADQEVLDDIWIAQQQARLVEDVEADEGRVRTGHLVQIADVPSWRGTEEHGVLEVAENQIGSERFDTASLPVAHLVTEKTNIRIS